MNIQEPSANSQTRLESWKEIGAYLQRDATTARRWEKEEGLPVHRHSHKSRSSVYAYPSEIDAWRASRKVAPEPVPARPLWKIPAFALTMLLCLIMVGNGVRPVSAQQASRGPITRQIWAGDGTDGNPSPSPDGRFLTFVDSTTGDLAIRDLTTGTNRRLTDDGRGGWSSVISPDGRQVVYNFVESKTNRTQLRILPLVGGSGSNPRVVGEYSSYISPLGWTPDNKQLLVMTTLPEQTIQLGMVSVQDGSMRVLKSFGWGALDSASLSPNGRHIAYTARKSTDDWSTFILAADGSHESELFEGSAAHNWDGVWSSDGSQLLFFSDRTSGATSLWRVAMQEGKASGPAVLVKADIGWIRPRGVTQSGALYYQTDFLGDRNVYTQELDAAMKPTKPAELGTQRFINAAGGGSWSPDGQYLAYYAYRNPVTAARMGTGLIIRTLKTGEEKEVSMRNMRVPPWGVAAPPRWFPDQRSVLVVSYEQRGLGYYRVDIASSSDELLYRTKGSQSEIFERPDLSPDGKTIFYIDSEDPSATQLMRFDLEGRRERELKRFPKGETPVMVAVSPNGEQLAYAASNDADRSTSLDIIPATGGQARTVFRGVRWPSGAVTSLAWTPDGRSLIFARPEDGTDAPQHLWKVPLAGGQQEKVGISMPNILFAQIHRDGRRIVFGTRQSTATEVWALENFLPTVEKRGK
jgi:Tol biopolymer transport system component